jgi:hypothetical protein
MAAVLGLGNLSVEGLFRARSRGLLLQLSGLIRGSGRWYEKACGETWKTGRSQNLLLILPVGAFHSQ